MKKILTCVGTRPNFIKVTQLARLFKEIGFEHRLLHTGQHFDANMSQVFFEELKLDEPDFYLKIGGGSHCSVVGRIIQKVEEVLLSYKPDLVIVPGDVNSTFACAFAASSMRIPVAHIESGLRSFDMEMPEERNRILTDRLSDILFVTEQIGVENLKQEGVDSENIRLVGNTIIDALSAFMPYIQKSDILNQLGVAEQDFFLTTFHRPVNVDTEEQLFKVHQILNSVSQMGKVVFPIHPRTKNKLKEFGLIEKLSKNVMLTDPLGYLDFMKLVSTSRAVISDSGGIQSETSYLGVPCFTVRDRTELKVTVEQGTNELCSLDAGVLLSRLQSKISKPIKKDSIPFWDGKASERIVNYIAKFLN